MQEVHFGSVESLHVRDREPVLDPPPKVVRDLMLGKFERTHPARALSDFVLKDEVVDLFELFDREQNIDIDRITIQAGLPLRLRVRIDAAA
jgi:hypothetical protein